MKRTLAVILVALALSTPALAGGRWSIVRDNSRHIIAGPFHTRGACERALRDRRYAYDHCALI